MHDACRASEIGDNLFDYGVFDDFPNGLFD